MLDFAGMIRIVDRATEIARARGHGHFAWRDAPSESLTREESDVIWKAKLAGVYSERCLASLGMLIPVVGQGYGVRFVQFAEEEGVPFDAAGWTVIAVSGVSASGEDAWWPILHLSPDDFCADGLDDIVEVVNKNDEENGFISWDDLRPTKPAEYAALLLAARCSCPDIIATIRPHMSTDDPYEFIEAKVFILGIQEMVRSITKIQNKSATRVKQWTSGKLFLNKTGYRYSPYIRLKVNRLIRNGLIQHYFDNQDKFDRDVKLVS